MSKKMNKQELKDKDMNIKERNIKKKDQTIENTKDTSKKQNYQKVKDLKKEKKQINTEKVTIKQSKKLLKKNGFSGKKPVLVDQKEVVFKTSNLKAIKTSTKKLNLFVRNLNGMYSREIVNACRFTDKKLSAIVMQEMRSTKKYIKLSLQKHTSKSPEEIHGLLKKIRANFQVNKFKDLKRLHFVSKGRMHARTKHYASLKIRYYIPGIMLNEKFVVEAAL